MPLAERSASYSQIANEPLSSELTDINMNTYVPLAVITTQHRGFLGYEYISVLLCFQSGQQLSF